MLINDIIEVGYKLIDRLIPDKNAADAAKIKWVELQQSGEFKKIESELEQSRIDAADVASARLMASDKAKAGQKDYVPPILALIVTIGFFGILLLLMFVNIDPNIRAVLDIMVGYLGASLNQVFGFYYGSSKSSRIKDETIAKLSSSED